MGQRGAKKGESRRKGKPNKSTIEIRKIIDANVDFAVVVQKMFGLVNGITVEGTNEKGETYLIDREPNTTAARILFEYRFGKPREIKEDEDLTREEIARLKELAKGSADL